MNTCYLADGSEFEESESVAIESLPILGQSAATVQPNDRTFDDPELPPGAEIKKSAYGAYGG
jgi:hypothetical protein